MIERAFFDQVAQAEDIRGLAGENAERISRLGSLSLFRLLTFVIEYQLADNDSDSPIPLVKPLRFFDQSLRNCFIDTATAVDFARVYFAPVPQLAWNIGSRNREQPELG